MESTATPRIEWEKIFALAALDAGIIISWTAYHNFQPKLLVHFHFEHLETFVLLAQSLVMLSVPLLAGWLTDYYRRKKGSGFSVFAIGISVASMIFMAVAFTISDQAFINLIWLLPALIVFWLISMNVFHSPANSILEAFSKSPQLPLMMAVLTISKVLIHGMKPVLLSTLDKAGGAFTFVAGGVILIVTGIWFARSTRNLSIAHAEGDAHEKDRFHIVLLYGLLAGLCNSLILHFFPDILQSKFGKQESIFHDHLYTSLMLGIAAVAAFPLSRVVQRAGIYKALVVSLLTAFVAMLLILVSGVYSLSIAASLMLALAYSVILITAFPYALHNISPRNATFGTGLFFASFEFFEVLFGLISGHH
jgi:MFS family permease